MRDLELQWHDNYVVITVSDGMGLENTLIWILTGIGEILSSMSCS